MDTHNLGRFAVLEGGEGAGKTTRAHAVKNSLAREGIELLTAREPGGTQFGEGVRNLFFSHFNDLSPRSALLTISGARSHLLEQFLEPVRTAGRHVLYDRYIGSTFAYQLSAQNGVGLEEVFDSIFRSLGRTAIPDLFIFLDVDPKIGYERTKAEAREANVIDEAGLEFHYRIRNGFQEFFRLYPGKMVTVDANQPEEVVDAEILRIMRELILG